MGLERLLEETPEAYYWIGFIMADGYIGHKIGNKCLIFSLSEKDSKSIDKLSSFLSLPYKNKISKWTYKGVIKSSKHKRLEKWDKLNVTKITNKFNFNERKTYNPPENLNIVDKKKFLSFLIGYIDGDGCIDKTGGLHIKYHKSWKNVLNSWFTRLYKIVKPDFNSKTTKKLVNCHLTKDGGALIEVYNNQVMNYLSNFVKINKLPVMDRKWDRVINKKIKNRNSFELKENIKKLLRLNKTQTEIAKILKINNSYVSYIKGGEKR